MAGTRIGNIKKACKEMGISVEEYIGNREKELKRCTRCKEWKPISEFQKDSSAWDNLEILNSLRAETITWMSFEPLSWDVAYAVAEHNTALSWAVIGAASNGKEHYQPDSEYVNNLLDVLDANNIPVFMKSNLEWGIRRMEFPKE